MAKADMRARVERLIHGEFHPEDISTLFLYLRTRSRGRQTIIEIGHFFAHRDEREMGLVTDRTKDWFTCMRFFAQAHKQPFPANKLPANFGEVLEAAFKQLSDQIIKRDTGLKRKKVQKLLPEIIRRLKPNNFGGLTAENITDATELSILNCLLRYRMGIQSAFSEDRLFTEFRDALLADGLLLANDAKSFAKARKALSLSAVAAMHLTEIKLGDGTKAELSAMADCGDETLGIMTKASVHLPSKGGDIFMASPVYVTSFSADACCESELLKEPSFPNWTCPIELTREISLAPLR